MLCRWLLIIVRCLFWLPYSYFLFLNWLNILQMLLQTSSKERRIMLQYQTPWRFTYQPTARLKKAKLKVKMLILNFLKVLLFFFSFLTGLKYFVSNRPVCICGGMVTLSLKAHLRPDVISLPVS